MIDPYDIRYRRIRAAIIAVLAVAVVVIAFLLLSGGDDDDAGDGGAATAATVASGDELRDLAADVGHTVYWAGERENTRTEFERTEDGNVLIRYLPDEGDSEDARNSSLTIGSYPVGDAIAGLEVVAQRPGANTFDIPGEQGTLVVSNKQSPNSVYIAFPDSAVQIEFYDDNPESALETALSGEIEPLTD